MTPNGTARQLRGCPGRLSKCRGLVISTGLADAGRVNVDCADRDQVMHLLRESEATRDPTLPRSVDVRQVDDHTLVVHSADGDTATRVIVGDGAVVAMQQFMTDAPR